MRLKDYRLGFIGFGHMAQILCQSLLKAKLLPAEQLFFTRKTREKVKDAERAYHIRGLILEELLEKSDLLLLCVRPQETVAVLERIARIAPFRGKMGTIVSGLSLSFYRKHLGNEGEIARIMPNIASEVGEGMTLFSFEPSVSLDFRAALRLSFASMGQIADIPEEMMHVGTALSGSGPGFVFRLIRAAAQFGIDRGLDPVTAYKMSAQTFLGAAKMISEGKDVEELIYKIATPQGITQAGFEEMNHLQIEKPWQSVFAKAAHRSEEISR